jgi:hypothetical protein
MCSGSTQIIPQTKTVYEDKCGSVYYKYNHVMYNKTSFSE